MAMNLNRRSAKDMGRLARGLFGPGCYCIARRGVRYVCWQMPGEPFSPVTDLGIARTWVDAFAMAQRKVDSGTFVNPARV